MLHSAKTQKVIYIQLIDSSYSKWSGDMNDVNSWNLLQSNMEYKPWSHSWHFHIHKDLYLSNVRNVEGMQKRFMMDMASLECDILNNIVQVQ